ncbi:MAG TPA: hypothetical protein VHM19_05295 [Polyangiales bacterium]|jgi:hypothetical protein|nr:hypothetical protein [Polyangiales bacterium]
MTRSTKLSALSLCVLALAAIGSWPAFADEPSAKVTCEILENGEGASGEVSIQQNGTEVATGTCGKELAIPAGTFDAILRLDGALDSPEQKQPLTVKKKGSAKLKADFATGLLEVSIASQGKRAAGMAIIKRDGKQIGTLGSGVPAHLSAGSYEVVARYRTQEKSWTDVKVEKGARVTLDASFE